MWSQQDPGRSLVDTQDLSWECDLNKEEINRSNTKTLSDLAQLEVQSQIFAREAPEIQVKPPVSSSSAAGADKVSINE